MFTLDGRFLTQMCTRFSPSRSAAPWEEGADALVPLTSGEQSTAACAGPAFSGGPARRSRSHRKVLRRWHLQGENHEDSWSAASTFAEVLPLGRTLADCLVQAGGLLFTLDGLSAEKRLGPACD